ncbi:unnamed protein product [Cuscuta epithymum]|uniref:Poly(A) RNA polymerase mitochondrial-like central palm domain-containing protein n=1 Tax=Cuscuta epithymum TaxID=186058 RepID=A0AAV0DL49_9ASTE|nr:unnamed protein product [Cuscuta epithymum]CAH9140774.1 unnamed protein product [Cuscuta epithymum]
MLRMDSDSPLEHTLCYILSQINPSKDDWSFRFQIIEELRAVVQPIESLRGATVEPFGSFVSDLFTRWGDLDLSIELANGSYISSAGKKQKQSLLEDVLKAMRCRGGYRKLRLITGARVPILKFEARYNISCDISINNLCGQMKSKLLYWISTIDERFRPLVLLVKEWAKAHKINDSRNGSMNSYSLSMLVIFHFQTCEPAILPPLKEIYPGNMVDDLSGVRVTAEKHIEDTCGNNINQFKSNRFRPRNRSSLSDLFISFLAKFCDIGCKASDQGISTYTGQWEDIQGNMSWLPKTYALFIEDPFEQPANTARSVSSTQLENITESFQATFNMLTSPDQNPHVVMSSLTRPQLPNYVERAPPARIHINHHTRNFIGEQQTTVRRPKLPMPILTRPHIPNVATGGPTRISTREQHCCPNQVMSTLTRPQKTNFIARPPATEQGNKSGKGNSIGGMHHNGKTIKLSLPHQFQKMMINEGKQPNTAVDGRNQDSSLQSQPASNRHAHESPAKIQPIWRPKNGKKSGE